MTDTPRNGPAGGSAVTRTPCTPASAPSTSGMTRAAASARRAKRTRSDTRVWSRAGGIAGALLHASRLLRLFVAGEVQVGDRHVDLGHREAGDALDSLDHVLADRLGDLRNRLAVFDSHGQVDRRLALADLDGHA